MDDNSDARRLRLSDADIDDEQTRDSEPSGEEFTRVGITTTDGSYPTTASAFYKLTEVHLLGTETEGSAGVETNQTNSFYALNLGTGIPPQGTYVITTFLAYRNVFRYD